MKKILTALMMLLTLCCLMPSVQAAQRHPAQIQVQQNIDTVLQIARSDDLNDRQKIARIEEYATPYLDYQRIAALAVGRQWKNFSVQQKRDFIDAFKEMMISLYAQSALVGATNAKVAVLPKMVDYGGGRLDVFTRVTTRSNRHFEVTYQLYKNGGNYRVYNVRVDGNSLVTLYRNQFDATIRQQGIDGTITALRQKKLARITKTL